ncbi:MAG: 2-phospho-L-lactate guanylyltransferase [Cryobacterium sp.]|uniref:2-phospho-L-lactate guanylyltransferase n=1 Tax=unclassified Cryobacterium TaxID=2649013 RepID=UPI001A187AA7|nr:MULTISPECIES: 2-phospho-L-lactate guanylyltransferase [unclassified Cryobacterium]MCY7404653.1 2-phospho-L-lactate guanylyltransferase [Cryobacterium sp.]MEC5154989.1 2-phospho-L-lactate guanylyltransferase [Cryobacterium sp. CAN_C3]
MDETQGAVSRMASPNPAAPRWAVVVPVKGSPGAKSRLGALPKRAALAEAFALDTVAALVAAFVVERVFVVTGSTHLGGLLAGLGAVMVPEAPGDETGHARLNAAIAQGIAAARRACPDANLAVMTGDLPSLRPADVETALSLAASHPRSMVPDADGVGTTTLLARAGVTFMPRFGPGSRAAHEADGHIALDLSPTSSMRRDVDTAADLDAARALGLGPHTSALLALSKR